MTAAPWVPVAFFAASIAWIACGLICGQQRKARDLEWVRIIARRDEAICAAVEAWPDNPNRPMEDFMLDDPEMKAAYDDERDRLRDCA